MTEYLYGETGYIGEMPEDDVTFAPETPGGTDYSEIREKLAGYRKAVRFELPYHPPVHAGLHRVHTGDYVFNRCDGDLWRIGGFYYMRGPEGIYCAMVELRDPDTPEDTRPDMPVMVTWNRWDWRKVSSI